MTTAEEDETTRAENWATLTALRPRVRYYAGQDGGCDLELPDDLRLILLCLEIELSSRRMDRLAEQIERRQRVLHSPLRFLVMVLWRRLRRWLCRGRLCKRSDPTSPPGEAP